MSVLESTRGAANMPPAPIAAEKEPKKVLFGKVEGENRGLAPMDPPLVREDPLFWLRDDKREDPEVLGHLKKEQDYLAARTAPLKDLENTIYDEHIAHLKETDSSAPVRDGEFNYYTRTVKGLSYPIYCRKKISGPADAEVEGEEEVYLDVNKVAEGKSQCVVAAVEVSPDHKAFTYAVDFTGNEVYEVRFVGVDEATMTGPKFDGGMEWGKDGKTLYYSTRDDIMRSHQIWRHTLGTNVADDELILQEDDEVFSISLGKSLQGDHIILSVGSSETSEVFILDLDAVDNTKPLKSQIKCVRPREAGVRYAAEAVGHGKLYISTNIDKCLNNKIVRAPLDNLSDWSDVMVAHDELTMLDGIAVFADFAIAYGRRDGLTQCWSILGDKTAGLDAATWERVDMPEPIYDVEIGANHMFNTPHARIVYSSLTTPRTWFHFNPRSKSMAQIKQSEVLGYDPAKFECECMFATAPDGRQIPMSVVWRKDLDRTKPQPTLLYGYGSYGICIDPSFSAGALPYTERGVIYVIAHIRGGGEMGRGWYEKEGKYRMKRNTFSDFIACAEHLVDNKVTTPGQMACEGRSAGGLLMGSTLNMRPDLFKVAIAGVPFVDVMTTMCDPSIPLTTGEWEEWGNPNEAKWFDYMLSYSPVDNVRKQPYPNILIVAGLHDPRVAYWEPTKWATKLRNNNTADTDIMFKIDTEVGHFSASDRYRYWREKAFEQSVVLDLIAPEVARATTKPAEKKEE